MDKKLIQELNDKKYLSCTRIQEENGVLTIYICGTYLKSMDKKPELFENNLIKNILDKDAKEIIVDDKTVFKITFGSYVGYHILNESYSMWDDHAQFEYGNLFRVYKKSNYLSFITETTYVGDFLDAYTHYSILCLDQIIDVISEKSPIITKQIR